MSEMTEPTIDGQIAYLRQFYKGGTIDAILASLEELKRIKSVKVPEYPEFWRLIDEGGTVVSKEDYDTLLDLLRRESADAKHYREKSDMLSDAAFQSEERAEAAEAKLAAVMKFGNEPSEEMQKLVAVIINLSTVKSFDDAIALFKVVFAKLVEQAGVGK